MKKKYGFLIIFLLAFINLKSQSVTFHKTYPGVPNESSSVHNEIIQTPDGGYLTGNNDGKLLKIDSLGIKQWMKQITGPGPLLYSFEGFCKEVSDNGYYASGVKTIYKLDSNFNISWAKELIVTGNTMLFYTIKKTYDNNLIIGATDGAAGRLIKTDTGGNVLWAKQYNLPVIPFGGFGLDFVAKAFDGGFVISGTAPSIVNPFSLVDIVIIKTDSLGNSQWGKVYTSIPSTSYFNHIIPTADSNFVICGLRNQHRYLLKIDMAGNKLWEKYYASEFTGSARWVEELPDKSLIVVGDIDGADSTGQGRACFLMKTDSSGNLIWAHKLGGYAEVWSGCVKPTNDGGFVIGCRRPGGANSQSIAIIKTDSLGHTNGCLDATPVVTVTNLNDTIINVAVSDSIINIIITPLTLASTLIGSEITLCSSTGYDEINYYNNSISIAPNPNDGNFIINYELPQNKTGMMEIYDVMGNSVYRQPLPHWITMQRINLKTLTAGIYVVKVYADGSFAGAVRVVKE